MKVIDNDGNLYEMFDANNDLDCVGCCFDAGGNLCTKPKEFISCTYRDNEFKFIKLTK